MFPFGNPGIPKNDWISIYLNYANSKKSDTWHVCVQFALVLSNPAYPRVYVVKSASPCSLRGLGSFLLQMHSIGSFPKRMTGVSHDSPNIRSFTNHITGIPGRLLRMTAWRSPRSSGFSRTQQACCGTVLKSKGHFCLA
jgi:hypothetical protein